MDGDSSEPGGLSVTDGANGRTPMGHFAKGNRLGKGNPNARRMHELRQQFLDAVNEGTIPALARKLQVQALNGDEFAIKLFLEYAIGKPSQAVELVGPSGESLDVNMNLAGLSDEDLTTLRAILAKLAPVGPAGDGPDD